jgi:hypothetical protein
MTNLPNSLMIKFLTVAESGGNAGMDEGERDIAVAVGIARQEKVEPSTVMRRIQRVKDGMKALAG